MDNKSELVGVNEAKLDMLILDINNSALEIKNKLEQISDLVDSTKFYFEGDAGDCYRNKFSKIKLSFTAVSKSIVNISGDLVKAKASIRSINDKVIDNLENATSEI